MRHGHSKWLACVYLPEMRHPFLVRGEEDFSFRAKGQRKNRAIVPKRRKVQRPARSCIPQPASLVATTRGHDLAVRSEGHSIHVAFMLQGFTEGFARIRIP